MMKKIFFLVGIIFVGAFIVSMKQKVSANTGVPKRMDFSKLKLDTTGLDSIRTEALKTYEENKKEINFDWLLNSVRAVKKHFTANRQFNAQKWIKENRQDLALAAVITNYKKLILDTARAYGIKDFSLMLALPAVESSGNPSTVHPRTQATGLFQPLPATGAIFGYSQEELKNPKNNTSVGIQYYLMMLKKYNGDVATALEAYNMGPTAVDSLKNKGEFDLDNCVFHKKVFALSELVKERS